VIGTGEKAVLHRKIDGSGCLSGRRMHIYPHVTISTLAFDPAKVPMFPVSCFVSSL
jgi:hypothetical protein